MSEKKFKAFQLRMLLGMVIWVGDLLLGLYYWGTLEWYSKVLVGLIAFLLVPSLDDIKDSLKSYEQYKREWERSNDDRISN